MERIWGLSYIKFAYFLALLASFVAGTILIIQDNRDQQGSFVYSSPVALAAPATNVTDDDAVSAAPKVSVAANDEKHDDEVAESIKTSTVSKIFAAEATTKSSAPTQTSEPVASEPIAVPDVRANLFLDGSLKGEVTVPGGSNHCDLLSTAREQAIISGLVMEWKGGGLNSYAVYVIDGRGDPNSVWWVYEVNGKSPKYGCSHVPVEDGDSVNWKYIR